MKYSLILQLFATVALAAAAADDLAPPDCALPCVQQSIAKSGCGATDFICQCTTGKTAISNAIIPCLSTSKCSNADFQQLQIFGAEFCPQILSSASASPSSTATATASATSSGQVKSTAGTSTTKVSSVSQAGSSTSPTSTTSPSSSTSPTSGASCSNRGLGFTNVALSSFAIMSLAVLF